MIAVAPFWDRIVHHALVNVLEPVYEKRFIFDSYATRKGKGTHRAVYRAKEFIRKNRWFLKMDIKSYSDRRGYPSGASTELGPPSRLTHRRPAASEPLLWPGCHRMEPMRYKLNWLNPAPMIRGLETDVSTQGPPGLDIPGDQRTAAS